MKLFRLWNFTQFWHIKTHSEQLTGESVCGRRFSLFLLRSNQCSFHADQITSHLKCNRITSLLAGLEPGQPWATMVPTQLHWLAHLACSQLASIPSDITRVILSTLHRVYLLRGRGGGNVYSSHPKQEATLKHLASQDSTPDTQRGSK